LSALVEEGPQAIEPVSLDLAKSHLRVDIDDDDTLIKVYVQAARELSEENTGKSFITKGYRYSLDAFPSSSHDQSVFSDSPISSYLRFHHGDRRPNYSQRIKLPRWPLDKISRISYLALDDSQWHDLLPAPFVWEANTEYRVGEQIVDTNGNLQEVVTSVPSDPEDDKTTSSGPNVPTWNPLETYQTTDGELIWQNRGVAPTGDFIYDADSEPPRVFPLAQQYWPATVSVPNAVQIHFTAGYGDHADDVPARALVLILQLTGNWYENRESTSELDMRAIPTQFDTLVWSLKVTDFSPTRG
jgi:uncharacterized phiE125 gp8 family phage protein